MNNWCNLSVLLCLRGIENMDMEDIREKYRKVTNEKNDRSYSETYLDMGTSSNPEILNQSKISGTLKDLINDPESENTNNSPVSSKTKSNGNSISKAHKEDKKIFKKFHSKKNRYVTKKYNSAPKKEKNVKVVKTHVLKLNEPHLTPSIDLLIATLKNEDSKVRRRAVYYLGEIGGIEILDPLKQILDDKDHSVRRAVAKSLGKVGNYEAMYLAIGLLEDENFLVRETAAGVLGNIGNKNAIEQLKKAKQDENILVNMAAAKSIQKIKDKYYN